MRNSTSREIRSSSSCTSSNRPGRRRRRWCRILPVIRMIKELGVRVSLFMDPAPEHMELAKALGADRIELYTEPYAAAFARGEKHAADPYEAAARRAFEVGLEVNAGHDLNLKTLPPFLKQVPHV